MSSGLSQLGATSVPEKFQIYQRERRQWEGSWGGSTDNHNPCPLCAQILNDIGTCRQRLWKKAFIGVVVSTLPMNWNTRPPGSPNPLPCLPPPPLPIPQDPGNGRQCGMGPTPLSEVQSLPLALALPSSPYKHWVVWFGVSF